ncbi:hypothetical protein G6F22_018457 [Rhizopus arrhizus]|nr:hypothetical protein G6F22_018457 [Rhizopus arrhizus]
MPFPTAAARRGVRGGMRGRSAGIARASRAHRGGYRAHPQPAGRDGRQRARGVPVQPGCQQSGGGRSARRRPPRDPGGGQWRRSRTGQAFAHGADGGFLCLDPPRLDAAAVHRCGAPARVCGVLRVRVGTQSQVRTKPALRARHRRAVGGRGREAVAVSRGTDRRRKPAAVGPPPGCAPFRRRWG